MQIDNRYIFTKQLSLIGSTMGSKSNFEEVLTYLENEKLKPIIDKVLPLSEGKEAYSYLSQVSNSEKFC